MGDEQRLADMTGGSLLEAESSHDVTRVRSCLQIFYNYEAKISAIRYPFHVDVEIVNIATRPSIEIP